ncbi:hypothetical protein [Ktedonospora formicarum]|nr:hypothetical protein [Ktedonospora formicarum]
MSYWFSDKSPLFGLLAKVAVTHNGRYGNIGLHIEVKVDGYLAINVVVDDFYTLANLGKATDPVVVRYAMVVLDDAMFFFARHFYQTYPDAIRKGELHARVNLTITGKLL